MTAGVAAFVLIHTEEQRQDFGSNCRLAVPRKAGTRHDQGLGCKWQAKEEEEAVDVGALPGIVPVDLSEPSCCLRCLNHDRHLGPRKTFLFHFLSLFVA